jgi:ABC-type bacteriocin/lantibiotic exporter with double-glycine peptidase domain
MTASVTAGAAGDGLQTHPFPTEKRSYFVPEVVQTSATDCGPATLKAVLEGFGIPISYGRLREACQTTLDGSSIDTLEDVANLLGLDAQQLLVPIDHVLLPAAETLPAIVVTQLRGGATHFVVLWRTHGPFVQVMDPAIGRRWVLAKRLKQEMFTHRMIFPAQVWRQWAGSEAFCNPLRQRLLRLIGKSAQADEMVADALNDPTWFSLAGLDAVVRQTDRLVAAGGLTPGQEVADLVALLFQRIRQEGVDSQPVVGWSYWSVQPLLASADDGEEVQLQVRGAVLLQVAGAMGLAGAVRQAGDLEQAGSIPADAEADQSVMPLELAAALIERPIDPAREIWRLLREDGLLAPGLVAVAALISGIAVTAQAFILRSLTELWRNPILTQHRTEFVVLMLLLTGLLVAVDIPVLSVILRSGRRLETRIRLAFLQKLPRINDRYFRSRLTSDMARRAQSIQSLRGVPLLGFSLVQNFALLLSTAIGLVWLDPASAWLVLLAVLGNVALIVLAQPVQAEMDLRQQSHAAGLSRFFLDVLQGLLPVRSHSAAHAIRREHESRLVELHRTNRTVNRFHLGHDALLALFNVIVAVTIVFSYISREQEAAGVLLLLYWTLNISYLSQRLIGLARQYPRQRNQMARLLEPLGAAEDEGTTEEPTTEKPTTTQSTTPNTQAVSLHFSGVQVVAGGHTVLDGVELNVNPGEHVAIVGRSGAGKSSLVGLLLGWRTPVAGEVLFDGEALDGKRLQILRRETVWVDPSVQIWNRSLLDNLRYGRDDESGLPTGTVLQQAELIDVLRSLPAGMQTRLGESGGLVSGGEGQRVRLGRGMMQPNPRLVILDEPFRGLDRSQRHELLTRTRQTWQAATLLCITHDVSAVLSFDRVVVMEAGRIVEDGPPGELASRADSRFRALLAKEENVRRNIWQDSGWRRLRMERGKLVDSGQITTVRD